TELVLSLAFTVAVSLSILGIIFTSIRKRSTRSSSSTSRGLWDRAAGSRLSLLLRRETDGSFYLQLRVIPGWIMFLSSSRTVFTRTKPTSRGPTLSGGHIRSFLWSTATFLNVDSDDIETLSLLICRMRDILSVTNKSYPVTMTVSDLRGWLKNGGTYSLTSPSSKLPSSLVYSEGSPTPILPESLKFDV